MPAAQLSEQFTDITAVSSFCFMRESSLPCGHLQGVERIMASLLCGAGPRLLECCRLRVKDVDFARKEISVLDVKGNKDRLPLLPGQSNVNTTMVYTHILNRGGRGVRSPLDSGS